MSIVQKLLLSSRTSHRTARLLTRTGDRAVSSDAYKPRNPIPATFLRGGTSKGIYLNKSDLPADESQWDRIFLGIMGSPDPEHGRQLNGMGGGVSSLSKICVVGHPAQPRADIDVEYTFAQIGIRDATVDYSGNCGNLSSMIGVFALDEGMCGPDVLVQQGNDGHHIATIRAFNTNTGKRIDTSFPVTEDGHVPVLDLPQATVAGVPGKASQITLDFVSPGGARTGKLLPTGNPTDTIDITACKSAQATNVPASLVDATNPTVFITSDDLRRAAGIAADAAIEHNSKSVSSLIEHIRQRGAERMRLDPSAQAQPKIAVLSPPRLDDAGADIVVHAYSMGVLHKAVPMTLGLCLGVAAKIKGTLAYDIVRDSRRERAEKELLTIRHPGGTVNVGADMTPAGEVRSAKVVRTGRRLMKGVVWW
ncbi:DUF453-domain-containing protein [Neolentinus lepideus HHB14362 ss-1]|uniref:DUF453-domain-containing protein n=1 Tax=Neolentinus lepideus HHB14362 ss-1 TaxID=1314782 RepID=A0A165QYS0_9AGAM|nr:DUF453-domain-containing protein [Neolentinus lepideus HHB14362 ss-1]